MKNKLLILFGGPSSERDVSFGTKDFFYKLYLELNPMLVEWTTDHNFLFRDKKINETAFLENLSRESITVLIASHGEYVEDGYIQEKFERYGIPFTGSSSKSCKLAMNKYKSQETVKNIVDVIPTYKTFDKLEFPFIAKPNSLGSSIGVYLINNEDDLQNISQKLNENYIFQPYVQGRELSLGSVRTRHGFLKLYPTEIKPKKDFFDYEAKYKKGMAVEVTPAKLNEKLTNKLIDVTNKIHNSLGLGYYSRSDFILSDNNKIMYLETNSLPGMTETSIVPQQLRYTKNLEQFKKGLLDNVI